MATFGNTTVGTDGQLIFEGVCWGTAPVSPAVDAEIISISAHILEDFSANTHQVKAALYSSTGELLGQTAYRQDISLTPAWVTFTFDTPIQVYAANSYILCVAAGYGGGAIRVSSANAAYQTRRYAITWPTLVDPATFSIDHYASSIYATYVVPQVRGSLVVSNSGDYIRRRTNLPSPTNFTMAGWAKADGVVDTYETVASINQDSFSNYINGYVSVGTLNIWPGDVEGSVGLSAETWYYFSLSGTTAGVGSVVFRVWGANGSLIDSIAIEGYSWTPDEISIGSNSFGSYDEHMNGKYAYWRTWNAVLSQSELEAEMFSETPVRTTNIDSALHNANATDLSGNGRDWTLNSITTSSDFPDVFPAGDGHGPIPIPQPLPGALGVYRSIRGRVG